MTRLGYWFRALLGLQVKFYCDYQEPCRCYSDQYGHDAIHVRCRHCTNPLVYCSNCGAVYMDHVTPSPNTWMFTLFRGWRHVRCSPYGPR
jgi:hypothetical protein